MIASLTNTAATTLAAFSSARRVAVEDVSAPAKQAGRRYRGKRSSVPSEVDGG
jgi:hypothetical protein